MKPAYSARHRQEPTPSTMPILGGQIAPAGTTGPKDQPHGFQGPLSEHLDPRPRKDCVTCFALATLPQDSGLCRRNKDSSLCKKTSQEHKDSLLRKERPLFFASQGRIIVLWCPWKSGHPNHKTVTTWFKVSSSVCLFI